MCQDRVDSDSIRLTHEFLAQMLGSGRPSLGLAAGILERAGMSENRRGRMKILNRKQLAGAACECYRVIQNFTGGLGLKVPTIFANGSLPNWQLPSLAIGYAYFSCQVHDCAVCQETAWNVQRVRSLAKLSLFSCR